MKHTDPRPLLHRDLLCFVRDHNPTVEEFLRECGGPGGQAFHVLRKCGALVVEDGRVRLNRRHLSSDGRRFVWGIHLIHLDDEWVEVVRWGPNGPPHYSDDA